MSPHHTWYSPGDNVGNIDTSATPGFGAIRMTPAHCSPSATSASPQLQEMLYANSRGG